MIGKAILLASISITSPSEFGQAPYDLALNFCEDKGGLAIYRPLAEVVEFSCGDEPNEIYTIKES